MDLENRLLDICFKVHDFWKCSLLLEWMIDINTFLKPISPTNPVTGKAIAREHLVFVRMW